jgi:peptide/nickel transport system permease protein
MSAQAGTRDDSVGWARIANVGGRTFYVLRRRPVLPALILTTFGLAAIFAPLLAPHDPYLGSLVDERIPPVWHEAGTTEFPLGTDPLGRDILSRIIYGARVSLSLAGAVIGIGTVVGTTVGLLSGWYGGIVDDLLMRLAELNFAIPFVLVALAAAVVFGPSFGLMLIMLSIYSWAGFARQIRAQVLLLKSMDYVALAQVAGASTPRLLLRHILPGLISTVVVLMTLNVGLLILSEASLSFLGVGIPGPTPAWGSMVAEGRNYIAENYWIALLPGVAIFLIVYAMNFIGDWLRDRWDPRLRQI